VAVGASRRRWSGQAIRPAWAAGCQARGGGFACGEFSAIRPLATPPMLTRPSRQSARQAGADRQL
ncbi:MAG: hypothetical protein LWW81_09175, partial [Rhodocyclales bacterium]|nr:hypothetical protein [Rhodocyclales bacterium]